MHRTEDRPMPASEARIAANRQNSLKSTGPKTPEGKGKSRQNALKHGLTGEGVVLSNEDSAEVERTFRDLEAELRPSGPMGRVLVRRVATCIVRMERSVLQETAALSERVLEAQAEAEANGEDPVEAGHRAMFDPSKEATLARKYEAAAERGMYKAIKEFRQIERESRASGSVPMAGAARSSLGSFLPEPVKAPAAGKPAEAPPRPAPPTAPKPSPAPSIVPARPLNPPSSGVFELPFTIGRAG
jgi:hypothetical protein